MSEQNNTEQQAKKAPVMIAGNLWAVDRPGAGQETPQEPPATSAQVIALQKELEGLKAQLAGIGTNSGSGYWSLREAIMKLEAQIGAQQAPPERDKSAYQVRSMGGSMMKGRTRR
jgi:hypothetical protein